AADAFLEQTPPRVTITGAKNTNPVEFTTREAIPWVESANPVYISGATGSWSDANIAPPAAGRVAVRTGSHSFTIPIDARSFGSFSGQTLTVFFGGGEANGYLPYGQTGSGWYDAFLQLGLVYKITGNTAYAAKALQLLDWINELGAAGMTAPVTQDAG